MGARACERAQDNQARTLDSQHCQVGHTEDAAVASKVCVTLVCRQVPDALRIRMIFRVACQPSRVTSGKPGLESVPLIQRSLMDLHDDKAARACDVQQVWQEDVLIYPS